jgi:hypothetical protein
MVGTLLGKEERSRRLLDQGRHKGRRGVLGDGWHLPEGGLREALRDLARATFYTGLDGREGGGRAAQNCSFGRWLVPAGTA